VPIQAQLVLAVLFGVAGWHHARHLERKYGTPAWGLPSWVWGLITAFSLLLGAILLFVAERTLKKQPQHALGMPAYAGAPAYAPLSFPDQAAQVPVPLPAQAPVQEPAAPVAPAGVPAGWHPDPSGKYEHRWWDGTAWTKTVATNGVTGTDA
jgi:hypothetical protein